MRRALVAAIVVAACCVAPTTLSQAQRPARAGNYHASFARFVDRYLDDFARRHPSIAAGNGIHTHDDILEDFSARAIAREVAALKRDRTELTRFDEERLNANERVDRHILLGIIDGWLLEQETLANWRRNPMVYASALTDGVHNLMTVESDPAPVRMRHIIAKLRHVPTLLRSARTNVHNPPRLFAERGAAFMHGASGMLGRDLEMAFASDPNRALRDSLRAAGQVAGALIDGYATWLERDVMPRATGDYAIGGAAVARRYRAEELIDTPLDSLTALGERELRHEQAAFRSSAERVAPGVDPQVTWLAIRRDHPAMGDVVRATSVVVDSLTAFVERRHLASRPAGERVVVRPAPAFDLGFASMHARPPLESPAVQSVFYITDATPDMTPAQRDAWLERFNYASLSNTAAHEAMPGHWLHSIYMRRTPGKVRRIWVGLNPFPQPSSGQDGWAHYAEQMVLDEGFGGDDPKLRMAQSSDALTRICRLLSGIRLHTRRWTLADAQRCFEKEAYVPTSAARREAERGTYDPTYGGYFLGKRGIIALREDSKRAMGASFDLRAFHEKLMSSGIAPVWGYRELMGMGGR